MLNHQWSAGRPARSDRASRAITIQADEENLIGRRA
jgi:hypothetical protein